MSALGEKRPHLLGRGDGTGRFSPSAPVALGVIGSAAGGAQPPAGALAFHCGNCKLEWAEPYCDLCGANLVPKE